MQKRKRMRSMSQDLPGRSSVSSGSSTTGILMRSMSQDLPGRGRPPRAPIRSPTGSPILGAGMAAGVAAAPILGAGVAAAPSAAWWLWLSGMPRAAEPGSGGAREGQP